MRVYVCENNALDMDGRSGGAGTLFDGPPTTMSISIAILFLPHPNPFALSLSRSPFLSILHHLSLDFQIRGRSLNYRFKKTTWGEGLGYTCIHCQQLVAGRIDPKKPMKVPQSRVRGLCRLVRARNLLLFSFAPSLLLHHGEYNVYNVKEDPRRVRALRYSVRCTIEYTSCRRMQK